MNSDGLSMHHQANSYPSADDRQHTLPERLIYVHYMRTVYQRYGRSSILKSKEGLH
jgi:hypothetical protein